MTLIIENNLSSTNTMSEAIQILQNSDIKLVLITQNEKLIGTITDGDVRRALLNGYNLESKCSVIMNKEPKCAKKNECDFINELLVIHQYVPILDENNKLIDIVSKTGSTNKAVKDNHVIIMAGGEGKRLLPLTRNIPKPLLPLQQKPIIHEIIGRLLNYGLSDIYISIYHKAEVIKDYFIKQLKNKIKIKFLEENKPLGTAGSLSLLKKSDISTPCIVINGDVLTDINYLQLIDYHKKSNKDITVCAAFYDIQIPFGTMEIENDLLINIVEKPVKKYLINAGIYIINPSVIQNLDENKAIDMTDIISSYIKKDAVCIFPMYEQWLDIGNHENYKKARE